MWEKELEAAKKAALLAEVWIKEVYATDFDVEIKSDDSPVTKADKGADEIIRKCLHEAFPGYAMLTEESKDDKSRLENDFVWIVDPVDGTKEFVSRNGEFTTNIGLAYKHEIVVGVINVPMKDTMYYATKGGGAYRERKGEAPERIHVSDKVESITVLHSISFFNEKESECIKKHASKIGEVLPKGASTKFCAIAEGSAELSYRFSSNTKEWDTASGTIIIKEAGGNILKPDGTEMTYNREDVYNREGYLLINRIENFLI